MKIKRFFTILVLLLFASTQIVSTTAWAADQVTGMSTEQRRLLQSGSHYYDLNTCSPVNSTSSPPDEAATDLSSVVDKYKLQSVMIKELGGSVVASYKANEPPATPASTMKLIIADTVLRSGESLNQNANITKDLYYSNTNDLGKSTVTLKEALTAALKVSSNVASNVLIKSLGGVSDFTQKAQSYGYTHTTVKGYYDPSNDGKNTSTISDQVDAMDHIFSTNGTGYGIAKDALEAAANGPENHYGVDDDANKWAGTSTVAGNVGKFSVDGKNYIIGLYYNGDFNSNKAKSAMKDGSADLVKLIKSGPTTPESSSTEDPQPTETAASVSSQDEKIAQTFIVGFDASTPKSVITGVVSKFHIGGVYFTGNTDLEGAGYNKEFFDSLNTAAGTPLTVASDEEGGKVQRYEYPALSGGLPSAKAMGKMSSSKVKNIAKQVAKELKGNGVTVDLAPVVDLNDGHSIIAQNDRAFSDNPQIASEKAQAFAQGLQEGGITPVFKHFPGFGGAGSGNTDTTAVTTPSSYDLDRNIKPYKKVLADKGTSGVMLSNLYVSGLTNGKPASISKSAVDYVRNNLNYSGPITTDDIAALGKYGGKSIGLSEAISDSLSAGVTMPLFGIGTSSQPDAEAKIRSAIDKVKAEVSVPTIDKAYEQVMTFKGSSPTAAASAETNTTGSGCCTISSDSIPAGTLPTFIPEPYNGAFTAAADKYDVAPALLAALFSEENALGGDTHNPDPPTSVAGWASFVKRHPDPNSGWATSSASAQGPFQFIPSTWTGLGFDIKDINNLVKSAEAAAKYAKTNGATKDKPSSEWKRFIFSYNHADWYVAAVLEYYEFFNAQSSATPGDPTIVTSTTTSASDGCTASNGSVRDEIVRIATQELEGWKSEPDYDKPGTAFKYAEKGYYKYSENRKEDWCADFTSWVLKESGKPLDEDDWNVPAVASILSIGQSGSSGFKWHTKEDKYVPKPGDIAIHGKNHVNILVAVNDGTATYIGGNQGGGPYPGGSRVTKDTYPGFYTSGITGYVSPD